MPSIPSDVRLYAVGDTHGHDLLLLDLIGLVEKDALVHEARKYYLIFLGDYIDKGCNARGVIDILLYQLPDFMKTIFLRGNHEDRLLKFLYNKGHVSDLWVKYAAGTTGRSYGVPSFLTDAIPPNRHVLRQVLLNHIPSDHLRFLKDTQFKFRMGDYLFVHAGVEPGIKMEFQRQKALLRIRDPFLSYQGSFGPIIVHGHSPTGKNGPDVRRNRINIDTIRTGSLTALVLQGEKQSFIAVNNDLGFCPRMRRHREIYPAP